MDFWFSYITLASIYVLLGLSTNLLVGIAGIFSVSQAAVFGVGAYIVAYFLMNDMLSFLPAMAIAAACCIALNILVTLPALRVSGDYFVVTSFGIQLLATAVFTNWTDGTGGANGLPGIPPPDLLGKALESSGEVVALCVGGMVLGCLI
ncbi:MAG: branched-chain amino acid transport system permease protein, partial [Acetobacteraceae bacterium]|nr:branched-chain amino acid transport system permease protein [Acetobacteraceae bacterium]